MPEETSLFGDIIVEPPKTKPIRAVHPEVSAAARTLAAVRAKHATPAVLAKERMETGMDRAAKRANAVSPDWMARAADLFMEYARMFPHAEFFTESVRRFAKDQGLPPAPDPRAWGHVPRNLLVAGKIERGTPRIATNSNRCLKPTWRLASRS